MKAYDTITVNNNGQPFPDTRAVDSSGPLATDGTEIVKEVVDDVWLEKQALLDFYNYPPNGLDDLPGVDVGGLPLSQPLAAQYMNYGTPGMIVNWPSEEDPTLLGISLGIDIRLLLLHGQGIPRADYEMLDFVVYIGKFNPALNATADNFYHADDALGTIRNPAGQYLILPDIRGGFWRALDPSGAIDPDGASRLAGSVQNDALQNIVGSFSLMRKDVPATRIVSSISPTLLFKFADHPSLEGTQIKSVNAPSNPDVTEVTFDTSGVFGLRTSVESRPKNITTHFAIRY